MSANASLNSVDRESYLVQRIIGQLSAAVAAIKEMGCCPVSVSTAKRSGRPAHLTI
jgi:hypothetical protein